MIQQSNPGNILNVSIRLGETTTEAVNFSSKVFMSEENLLYFHVERSQYVNINCFLNKTVSLSINNEQVKMKGDLQTSTKKETIFFLNRKLDDIILSDVRSGKVLVFIAEEAA